MFENNQQSQPKVGGWPGASGKGRCQHGGTRPAMQMENPEKAGLHDQELGGPILDTMRKLTSQDGK